MTETKKILCLVDIVVVSDEDHPGMKEFVKLWRTYGIIVVITLGARGAMAFHAEKEIVVTTDPVPDSEVVDSVGSGDIFSASFAYDYYNNKDVRQALTFGNIIARQCLFFKPDDIRIQLPR